MKLLVRDEYFRLIKSGQKDYGYRDAHITFINETTKEELIKQILNVEIITKNRLPLRLKETDMFTDEWILRFQIGDE